MLRRFNSRKQTDLSRTALLIAAMLLFNGCDTQNSATTPPAKVQEKPTEVVVIGTQHFITDMPEGYTPGHLRALLEKVSPDVLAVEAPSNVADPWTHAPNELHQVTKPWATKTGTKIFPTTWSEPNYGMQIGQMVQGFQFWGNGAKYQKLEETLQASQTAQAMTCEFMNSAAYIENWREYHTGLHELAGKDTPWEKLNANALKNIQEICREHEGKRVAVVYGGAHSYYFLDHLAKDPNVTLVPVDQFFPLTEKEVTAQTKSIDYLKAMRPLNMGAISKPQLTNAKSHLEELKEMPEFANDYLLFHGRCLLHEGKAKEALAEFQKLAECPDEVISKFDGKGRLNEVAKINSALALIQLGDPEAARLQLVDTENDKNVTPSILQWAKTIMGNISKK